MAGNPALNENTFNDVQTTGVRGAGTMTVQGTVNKTAILLALVIGAGAYTWNLFNSGNIAGVMPWMWGGLIVGMILGFVTIFKKNWSPVTAPVYAIAEGLALGGISAIYERQYHGIVLQAVMLTAATLAAMLGAYTMGFLKATDQFKRGVFAATGGIAIVYIASMVLGFFGIHIPGIFGNGMIGIGFSLFVVVIAALNLVIDFDFIEQGSSLGAPKYLEWYGGFGLLVTLVWLYLEILRLLAKLNSRRD